MIEPKLSGFLVKPINMAEEYYKEYYKKNRERLLKYKRQYYRSHKNDEKWEKNRKEYYQKWYRKNINPNPSPRKPILNEEERKLLKIKQTILRESKKYHSNTAFKFDKNLCSSLRKCIKNNRKYHIFSRYSGYTINELKNHLEKQFDDKMSWDNYGTYWVIDHIIPKSKFNIQNYQSEDFIKCWELNNIRPLEKIENCKKGNKII